MSEKMLSAGKGALFLTALSAISQALGFCYRVVLSRLVGAEVMGLYQLVMPVYSVILSLTAVGLTSAVSNLTSQHLALGNRRGADQTISACLKFFFLLLLPVGTAVILGSDAISVYLLGDARTQLGLILLIPCVALTGVENFHKHFFYGSGVVRPPAIVELLEQFVRTFAVITLLLLFLPQYPERVVGLIVTGMVLCEVFSSCTLVVLYHRRRGPLTGRGEESRVRRRRIFSIALPVGLNALLGNLLSAANSALIPQKLVEGGVERSAAVSQFGVVCGMTMPMLSLPIVFLGALNLVLVPRLSRACALDRPGEARRLISQAVSAVALLTLPCMAMMVVVGSDLGRAMFHQEGVGEYLVPLACAVAMNCGTSVLASSLNGLGRQRAVAVISLLGGGVQLGFTLALVPLPGVGMGGYVAGAVASAALELVLCLRQVVRATDMEVQPFQWLAAPGLAAALAGLVSNLLFRVLKDAGLSQLSAGGATLAFALILYLAALQAQGVRARDVLRLDW
ncbi:oligosaccharide flippase family protein [Pseudoflavonifractor sp. 60]|uniref:oligosaccharide flippase family protein n=1 Tax=Pseudoflavonifractor sp. 60 TaxID=2304576 RepID=UPI0024340740|nr:oligosaccharide flippase family protein [Pseudoflavonifractor sp. 60]